MEQAQTQKLNFELPFSNYVPAIEKAFFAKELAVMLESGLHLTQGLGIIQSQTKSKKFKEILETIENDIREGKQLSQAMVQFPDVFDAVMINITRSGEASGQLEKQLHNLGSQLERQIKIKNKIKGAMIYPIFILLAMAGVGILATVKIIPALSGILEGTGQELPLTTRIVLAISSTLIHRWYIILAVLGAIIIAVWLGLSSPSGKLLRDRWLLNDPTGLAYRFYLSRFTRTLGILIRSGVPIVDAVRIVSDVIGNQIMKAGLDEVAGELERGVPMSVPLQKSLLFPKYLTQMIVVGEQTGKLDEVLLSLADYYDDQTDDRVKNLSSVFEPIIIIIIGVGVGFMVFSILIPVYNAAMSAQG